MLRNRDLVLINLAFIAVLWKLWFFSFWSVSIVAVRRGIGRKPLVIGFTAAQCVLTLIFGFVVADIVDPAYHGAAFGMNNLIGEIGAVLSPAVSGALRDGRGWARRKIPAGPSVRYGVVVDRVNVSVLL